jgi:hypothetical protein
MEEFEPLIGEWHGEGEVPMHPPMKISMEAKIERLGKFIVLSSVGELAEVPDSEPQPMQYFDARGVKRLFMMALEGSTWGRWERGRGDAGDNWAIDFPITYFRR